MVFTYEKPAEFRDEDIREAFDTIDIHQNNFLTAEELRLFLDILGISASEKEIEEMIRMADANLMGKVYFEEFREMAKGQLLSPIGLALPPTLHLLEGFYLFASFNWKGQNLIEENLKGDQLEQLRMAGGTTDKLQFLRDMQRDARKINPNLKHEKRFDNDKQRKRRKALVQKFFEVCEFDFGDVFKKLDKKKNTNFREIDFETFQWLLELPEDDK